MKLEELEVYKMAREISKYSWPIFYSMSREEKKVIGDQFIRSIDSVSANIAEGYGRYHYSDRNKFNYNARGSLIESMHWLELLRERNLIKDSDFDEVHKKLANLSIKLNNYITATRRIKDMQ
jgi:four helix bundle protein